MPKLLMLKGLPGSGKSTLARELVDEQQYVRVNKDDLRAMLHNSKHSKSHEATVLAIRDFVVADSLIGGRNVVVDDTNFAPIHEEKLRRIAKDLGAQFQSKLIDTPLEVCIAQDLKRLNSVGHKVILQMYDQYLKPAPAGPPVVDPALPWAVICDLDGTLAHMNGRGPYDTSGYINDTYDETVGGVLGLLQGPNAIIFVSGRSEDFRSETQKWLDKHGWHDRPLLMRPSGDTRNDSIVKRELFEQNIQGRYNITLVLDDRRRVIRMWQRELGLKVLACTKDIDDDF